MSDMTPEDEALLREARLGLSMSESDQGRIKARVFAQVGVGLGVGASTIAASKTAVAAVAGSVAPAPIVVAASSTLVAMKVVGGLLMLGCVVGGGTMALHEWRPARSPVVVASVTTAPPVGPAAATTPVVPPRPVVSTPDPVSVVGPVVVRPPQPSAPAPAIAARRPPPVVPEPVAAPEAPAPAPQAATVALETRLLRDADEALRAGNGLRALALVEEHARSFPSGILAEERDAERVTVLCALGRVAQAREAAATFERDHPRSPLLARVRSSCAGL